MKKKLSVFAIISIGFVAVACEIGTLMSGREADTYQNWYLSEGKLENVSLDIGGQAVKLIGRKVVITRRVKQLDPEYDSHNDELDRYSSYYFVPVIRIVGKAEQGVSMTVVLEEFAASTDSLDAGGGTELDGGDIEGDIEGDISVSKIAPADATLMSQHEASFKLEDRWESVSVELPVLDYDPEIEGYEVHISIVKKGKGDAFFYTGLLGSESKLKED